MNKENNSAISQTKTASQLAAILRTAPHGILSVTNDGTIDWVNAALLNIFGYEESELIGQSIDILVPPAYRKTHPALVSQWLKHGQTKRMAAGRDIKGIRKDGTECYLEIGLNRSVVDNGDIQIVATIQNVDGRKELESERKELIDQLTATNDELERFAYICSHDLQEPARIIDAFSGLLQTESDNALNEQCQDYLEVIKKNAIHMKEIIRCTLDFARVGRVSIQKEQVNIHQSAQEIIALNQAKLDEIDAQIVIEHLPTVFTHPMLAKRIFKNLLENAIKFRQADIKPEFTIKVSESDTDWTFSFKDNGIGIEPKHSDRVFTMFQRIHRRDVYPGTGIGLSTCKKLVELCGGTMWFESEPNNGATFFFTTPKEQ